MVYARMSTTSLSSHIVLRHLGVCIYICIYIYKSNRGRRPRRVKLPPCIPMGCCSKWHRVWHSKDHTITTLSNRCVFAMDAKGRLSAHPCIQSVQIYGPVWFSLLSLYNRLRLLVGFVRTRDQPVRSMFENPSTTSILWTIFYTCPTCEWVVPLFWKCVA